MRAFITGVTGQDGTYLSKFLLDKGYEVHGYARRGSRAADRRVVLHEGDLTDPAALVRALGECRPHEIYNLGAQSHVGASFNQPLYTWQTTALPILHILEWVRSCKPNGALPWSGIRVYQASTSELFGNMIPPHNETSGFDPRSPYAIAKEAAHRTVRLFREAHGVYACSGILFNHESPIRPPSFVTRKISLGVARIKHGLQESLELGNLKAVRDWGFAGDYVEAMWLMLQTPASNTGLPQDYVIATGESHTVREFVLEALCAAGFNLTADDGTVPVSTDTLVKVSGANMRPSEVHSLRGDSTRARNELGWTPKVNFKQLVKMMVEADLKLVADEL